jgi:putative RNA 2'-phosphotransferase
MSSAFLGRPDRSSVRTCSYDDGAVMARRLAAALRDTVQVDDRRASKLLSLVLRHHPARIGITLDRAGWVDVDELLAALTRHRRPISVEQLARVVHTSDKQRFALDECSNRIRANQGHSVEVDLGLTPATPPDRLFHGTPMQNLDAIMSEGLVPGQRHAVHLSPDHATAHRVGARRGPSVVLVVDARAMHTEGHSFTVSANGVWLVPSAPARYLAEARRP